MKKALKILYIVHHRFNRSPGQRYRCEQYMGYLQAAGFECTYSPLIATKAEEDMLYVSKSVAAKAWIFGIGIVRRLRDVIRAGRYDIIFIYREAFYTGSTIFEKMLKARGALIVLDFDDAIWLPAISEVNAGLSWLKRPEKIKDIIKLSDKIIVGNGYLAAYTKQFNTEVVVFPSTIDLNYYQIPLFSKVKGKNEGKIIIGWSGSHTTIEHFETIIPVLKKLKQKHGDKIAFIVYGDPNYRNNELDITGVAWKPDTEVQTIASFDIGIMPLPDNEWTRGKCAMKGLLYMGLSVPAVIAAVGMNKDIINEGVNGFTALTDEEWFNRLNMLIEDESLRERLGQEGRRTIEEKFSCQKRNVEYVNFFLTLAGQIN